MQDQWQYHVLSLWTHLYHKFHWLINLLIILMLLRWPKSSICLLFIKCWFYSIPLFVVVCFWLGELKQKLIDCLFDFLLFLNLKNITYWLQDLSSGHFLSWAVQHLFKWRLSIPPSKKFSTQKEVSKKFWSENKKSPYIW